MNPHVIGTHHCDWCGARVQHKRHYITKDVGVLLCDDCIKELNKTTGHLDIPGINKPQTQVKHEPTSAQQS